MTRCLSGAEALLLPASATPSSIRVVNPRSNAFVFRLVRANLFLVCATVLVSGLTAFGAYVYYARDLPRILSFEEHSFDGVTTIVADDGQVIAELYEERRFLLPYEKLPRTLILAFLATEDSRFFTQSQFPYILSEVILRGRLNPIRMISKENLVKIKKENLFFGIQMFHTPGDNCFAGFTAK